MEDIQLIEHAQMWANTILVWIGFGTIVGLLAKAIMPGRDPGGALATLAMGIGGTVLGCGTLTLVYRGVQITPISLLGLGVATVGAFAMLLIYRVVSGYWWIEGEHRSRHPVRERVSRYRRRRVQYVEE